MSTYDQFIAFVPQNGSYYVSQKTEKLTEKYVKENGIAHFHPNQMSEFIEYVVARSSTIGPQNPNAADNIRKLIAFFDKDWIMSLLILYFSLDYNKKVTTLTSWKNLFSGIKNAVNPQGKPVNLMDENNYLSTLLEQANLMDNVELDLNNDIKMNKQKKLINETTSGKGQPIISSINTTSNMMARIAKDLGKVYNAKNMMISQENDNSILAFKMHTALYEILSEYGLKDEIDKASSQTVNSITKILTDGTLKKIDYSKIVNKLTEDQIIAGIYLGRLPLTVASKSITKKLDTNLIPSQLDKTIYIKILERLLPIFSDCNLDKVWEGKIRMSDLNCERQNPDKYLPFLNHNNIDNQLITLLLSTDSPDKIKAKTIKEIADLIKISFLSKNDYVKFKGLEAATIKSASITKDRLLDWQTQLVRAIINGESRLVISPTSGGKTFASMVAFDQLFQDQNVDLIYVAPNFYQALQVYLNIIKTFSSRRDDIGLLTKSINITPSRAKVWIGTPAELWLFATSSNLRFQRAIFDEIHTISTSYGEGFESVTQAMALMKLITLVDKQFIGLSATINERDSGILKSKITELTKIVLHDTIVNDRRPVPLKHHIWTNTDIVEIPIITPVSNLSLGSSSTSISKEDIDPEPFINITPESTFKLLKKIEKYGPTLIFDIYEFDSYTYFTDFIDYLTSRLNTEYSNWLKVRHSFSDTIEEFNFKLNQNENSKKTISEVEKERSDILEEIKDSLITAIITSMGLERISGENIEEELEIRKMMKGKTSPHKRSHQAVVEVHTLPMNTKNLLEKILAEQILPIPEFITHETFDLLNEYMIIQKSINNPSLNKIHTVCQSVGSYFNFSKKTYNSIFSQLLSPSTVEMRDEYNFMLDLTEAERARSDDIKNIFKLMDKALRFGVGILLPNMPFGVQYQILKMLDNRELDVVFVSKSMSMGVNFPARTCVIRSPEVTHLNVCEALQMQGRAGRWGLIKDDFALSIMWNVANARTISIKTLPLITYPDLNLRKGGGVIVSRAEEDAFEIAKIMVTIDNIVNLQIASNALSQIDEKIKSQKSKNYYVDDEDTIYDEEEVSQTKHVSKNIKISRDENMTNNNSLIASISKAVEVISLDTGFDDIKINNLTTKIQEICKGNHNPILKENAYYWAEQINIIKYGLQEIHTTLHKRQCTELLIYIETLYALIHRVSMRYLGFAYERK